MRIAVCDDMDTERGRLVPLLREYASARGLDFAFSEYARGEELLEAYRPAAFELIFLDVYMDGLTGVETARRLKAIDPNAAIVFTTTSREHGEDAFDVEALHYLVKPVEREKLFAVLDKWYSLLCAVKTVPLKCGRTTREVYVRDILYIDVLGRSSTVHTRSEDIETAMPLAAIEELLPPGEFARPIRYCLVSLRCVRSVADESLTLASGAELPLSRRERESMKTKLAAFRLRELRGRRGNV